MGDYGQVKLMKIWQYPHHFCGYWIGKPVYFPAFFCFRSAIAILDPIYRILYAGYNPDHSQRLIACLLSQKLSKEKFHQSQRNFRLREMRWAMSCNARLSAINRLSKMMITTRLFTVINSASLSPKQHKHTTATIKTGYSNHSQQEIFDTRKRYIDQTKPGGMLQNAALRVMQLCCLSVRLSVPFRPIS